MKKNVLVFPAGSGIGLEIYHSLKASKHFKLFGATSTCDHSIYTYENMLPFLPFYNKPDFSRCLNQHLIQYDIDYIFPAHDDLLELLLKLQARGDIKKNVQVVTSDIKICTISRSKRETYRRLKNIVPVPLIYEPDSICDTDFPLFLKPDRGQGSKGTKKIYTHKELMSIDQHTLKTSVICEYLPGPEYTIDCWTDMKGTLRFAKARVRIRTCSGISTCSKEVQDPRFEKFAQAINKELTFSGMWFFQLKERTNEDLVLLEIAPRVSGSMGFFRAKGVNLPLMTLYDREGMPIKIIENNIPIVRDCGLYPRYSFPYPFKVVYVDLDDTIIVDGRVNYKLIALMYQFKNENKTLKLITRHRCVHSTNPLQVLQKFNISVELFDEIIEVNADEKKSSFIKNTDAIFIDDSVRELMDVHQILNIPVFTPSQAIEVLTSYKNETGDD